MKCHYEVLGVPRDADDVTIKQSYRKLALQWHPDKNLGNTDEAKEQFQLVQQAYEVLSDRQERAWYDNHREQILHASKTNFEDNSVDVFQYFTSSCFKGYGDDDKGFYSVYGKVFHQIAEEDLEFMDDKDEFCQIPTFGTSTSDYESVVAPFYAYWTSYSTKKSYVWLDPYKITEIKGGKILKLVEKENKKVRQKAKRERNEEIRSLVAFVRKRDKRVQAYANLQEQKKMENRKKQEQISIQRRLERQMQLNESGSQAEWTKFDNVEAGLEQIEKHLAEEFGISESEDEYALYNNNLYCIACKKLFRKEKAFQAHESTNKHKDNVEKLRDELLESIENSDSSLSSTENKPDEAQIIKNNIIVNNTVENELDSDSEICQRSMKGNKNDNEFQNSNKECQQCTSNHNSANDSDLQDEQIKSRKQKKKKKQNILKPFDGEESEIAPPILNSDTDSDFCSSSNQKKKGGKKKVNKLKQKSKPVGEEVKQLPKENTVNLVNDLEPSQDNADCEPQPVILKDEKIKLKKAVNNTKPLKASSNKKSNKPVDEEVKQLPKENTVNSVNDLEPSQDNADCEPQPVILKDEKIKLNKAVNNTKPLKASSNKKSKKQVTHVDEIEDVDVNHCCVTCKAKFSSKNKLFEHLKKTGHSIYLPSSQNSKSKRKK